MVNSSGDLVRRTRVPVLRHLVAGSDHVHAIIGNVSIPRGQRRGDATKHHIRQVPIRVPVQRLIARIDEIFNVTIQEDPHVSTIPIVDSRFIIYFDYFNPRSSYISVNVHQRKNATNTDGCCPRNI